MVYDLVDDMGIKADQISVTPAASYLFEVDDKEKSPKWCEGSCADSKS